MPLSDIEVRDLEEQHTAVIRCQLPLAEASRIPALIGQAYEAVQAAGQEPTGTPFVRSHSMSADPLDLEIGWPIANPFTGDGDVVASTLPAGPAAAASLIGAYDQLPAAYEQIQTWCADHGREIAGAPWECYVTDPHEEPNPAKHQTDIYFPLTEE